MSVDWACGLMSAWGPPWVSSCAGGVRPLSTAEALDALLLVLASDARQVIVAHPDAGDPVHARRGGDGRGAGVRHRPGAVVSAEQFLPRVGLPLDRAVPLTDYGMNSIMSVELSEELSGGGVALLATLFSSTAISPTWSGLTGGIGRPRSPPPPSSPARRRGSGPVYHRRRGAATTRAAI